MAWWRNDGALRRFVHDLVATELGRLRPGRPRLPERPWPDALAIDADGLGADSLELIELSGALAEALGLGRSGLADVLLGRRTLGDWQATCRESLARFDDAIVFRSSGSTGAPHPCRHTLATLHQEVAALATLLPASRILGAVPAHHIYGFLFTILLPQRLGAAVVELPRSGPAGLAGHLRPGDVVVAHPAYWRGVRRACDAVPGGVTGVTSTAPCPPELFEDLRGAGFARLVEIYGASETGGIGWRERPGPFTLLPHWTRDPRGERLLARNPAGELAAVSPQDRLEWFSERSFAVLTRHDGAVQVGGVNVFPERVRAMLRRHPLVADARVRLMRPLEGDRLKAFIVPHSEVDSPAARAALAGWIDRELPVAERPRALTFGAALPIGPLGKPADWEIA